MFTVGKVSVQARRLIDVTYECLMRAIDIVRPGTRLGDIGAVIQEYAEAQRFSVVRDFCGHGLGRVFHAEPNIMHYGRRGTGAVLEEGMFFTIEPMINAGGPDTKILADDWTAVTRDRKLSAQFEHSIGVTADGCEVFTLSPKGYTLPPYEPA
jgi:methionyl aminopeptidase